MPPVAFRPAEYGLPSVPERKLLVVITRGDVTWPEIVTFKLLLTERPLVSMTWTITVRVPELSGVPLMTP